MQQQIELQKNLMIQGLVGVNEARTKSAIGLGRVTPA